MDTKEAKTRIAVVEAEKCKPNKCGLECRKICPLNHQGKLCIQVEKTSKVAGISESLCVGCGNCVKKCPFKAIKIINLAKNLEKDTAHRYSANGFKLHRLPIPRIGKVLGLLGSNGTGKSTALKILSNQFKPNFGKFDKPPTEKDIIRNYRGGELQNYFDDLYNQGLKSVIKIQYVDSLTDVYKGKLEDIVKQYDELDKAESLFETLELNHLRDRQID
jgi:ATP-binding cassette subfamily E protein 1